jgi:DNA repair exonuclease SbcCD nuclease subunit
LAFTFVHAADLHLASPFQGLARGGIPEAVVAHLREATFLAFRRLVDLCIERQAAFLLLAGDIFDDEECSLRDMFRFRDELARLDAAGIEVFAVHGNHDPLEGNRPAVTLPANTHVFGGGETETRTVINVPTATVTGISYRTATEPRKLARLYTPPAEPGFHIALLHANVGGDTGHADYAPCTVEQLRDAGFHYWALGHVHERRNLCPSPAIAYPGNLQGRNPRETGPRGALVVVADSLSGQAEAEFVPLQSVRWETPGVSIAGLDTLDTLEERLLAELEDLAAACRPSSVVARVSLTGRGALDADLRRENAVRDLAERLQERQPVTPPFLWIESLRLACGGDLDFAARRKDDDLAGEVLRQADRLAADPAWLDAALSELFQHHRAKRALAPLSDEQRAQLLREAAEQCVEALDEEA